MNWNGLLIGILFLIYGILMLNGIEIYRLGKDNGIGTIIFSIILIIIVLISSYYEIKKKKEKSLLNVSKIAEININIFIKYLCYLPIILVVSYFVSLLFSPMNEILLYIFLAAMIICKFKVYS